MAEIIPAATVCVIGLMAYGFIVRAGHFIFTGKSTRRVRMDMFDYTMESRDKMIHNATKDFTYSPLFLLAKSRVKNPDILAQMYTR
eukprot:TRINITY_DN2543_c0_g1_i1.p1 TRINITY_DN2543_c0_g1~~TRINITY_DN2543_c0_g1_i1.p1  ORF type:complete len:86 (-),score=4.56 TRINITY_DN2543_c0_g1_i1:147-404(-)